MANDFSKITIDGTTYNVKVPNKLKFGSKEFDGSSEKTITASDLGLSNALHFIGETTTALSDGSNTSSIQIGSTTHTATTGDVVLYESKEFVWQGSMWKELGDGSSHALKTISISAGGGLTGGGTLEANRTISHADTSSQESVSASGRRYITGVTLDDYGHVTGLTTGTETVNVPTVNNGTLTIQKNGTSVGEFTANQSGNVTANITVPTKTSDLTNDSGYTTNKGTVTSVSVKMNGTSKGTVTSSGTIDLGTVLTSHQDISGKQDVLSTAQMAAANSGITSAKVTKYDGYESTINGKQAAITDSNKLSASLVSGLATVATSGSYSDLQNIPTDIAKIENLSNPNLLINPNFAINQRGQTSYTGAGYGVDRWKGYQLNSMVCTPKSDGVTLTAPSDATGTGAFYRQVIEQEQVAQLAGKTITFSFSATNRGSAGIYMRCLTPDSVGDTPNIASGETKIVTKTITLASDITELQLVYRKGSGTLDVDINWAKLEIGSVATQFTPPNIAEELAKCQRYYQRFYQGKGGYGYPMISTGYAIGATAMVFPIALACSMRNTPTVTYSEIYYRYGQNNNKNNLITTINSPIDYAAKGASVAITVVEASGLTMGQPAFLQIRKDGYIAFDAEI